MAILQGRGDWMSVDLSIRSTGLTTLGVSFHQLVNLKTLQANLSSKSVPVATNHAWQSPRQIEASENDKVVGCARAPPTQPPRTNRNLTAGIRRLMPGVTTAAATTNRVNVVGLLDSTPGKVWLKPSSTRGYSPAHRQAKERLFKTWAGAGAKATLRR